MLNPQQKSTLYLEILKTLCEVIKVKGTIPSGELYAHLMPYGCSLEQYESLINTLLNTGLVKRQNHLLTWVPPMF